MSPTPEAAIDAAVAASPLLAKYGTALDRESAHEILTDEDGMPRQGRRRKPPRTPRRPRPTPSTRRCRRRSRRDARQGREEGAGRVRPADEADVDDIVAVAVALVERRSPRSKQVLGSQHHPDRAHERHRRASSAWPSASRPVGRATPPRVESAEAYRDPVASDIRPYRPADRDARRPHLPAHRRGRRRRDRRLLRRHPDARGVRAALRGVRARARLRRRRRRPGARLRDRRGRHRAPSSSGGSANGRPGFAARHPSAGSPTAHDPAFTEAHLIDAGVDPERMRIAELDDVPGAPAHRPAARAAGPGHRAPTHRHAACRARRARASPQCTSAWTRRTPARGRSTTGSASTSCRRARRTRRCSASRRAERMSRPRRVRPVERAQPRIGSTASQKSSFRPVDPFTWPRNSRNTSSNGSASVPL